MVIGLYYGPLPDVSAHFVVIYFPVYFENGIKFVTDYVSRSWIKFWMYQGRKKPLWFLSLGLRQ